MSICIYKYTRDLYLEDFLFWAILMGGRVVKVCLKMGLSSRILIVRSPHYSPKLLDLSKVEWN